jgi:ATP-dependent DNA helicase RecG
MAEEVTGAGVFATSPLPPVSYFCPMDWSELEARLGTGLDERTELGRFRSFGEKDWLEAVAAFANTDGGVVILGIRDDGTIEGVPMDPSEVHERLTGMLQTGLSGPVQARVRSHRTPEGTVFWIEVAAMRGPEPLRLRERVLLRRQRANVAPSGSELRDLYNSFGLILTEERIVPGATATDIDFEAYRRFLTRRGIDLDASEPLPVEQEFARAEILDSNLDGLQEAPNGIRPRPWT